MGKHTHTIQLDWGKLGEVISHLVSAEVPFDLMYRPEAKRGAFRVMVGGDDHEVVGNNPTAALKESSSGYIKCTEDKLIEVAKVDRDLRAQMAALQERMPEVRDIPPPPKKEVKQSLGAMLADVLTG